MTYQKDGRTDTRLQEELLPRGEGTLMLFSGRASGKIVPTEAGRYLLRAEDISGGSRASQYIYVYGDETAGPEAGSETVEIITDRERYRPGEKLP